MTASQPVWAPSGACWVWEYCGYLVLYDVWEDQLQATREIMASHMAWPGLCAPAVDAGRSET